MTACRHPTRASSCHTGKDTTMNRPLTKSPGLLPAAAAVFVLGVSPFAAARSLSGLVWPEPPVITPGDNNGPPSDAIVLFDGKNFDAWTGAEKWTVDPDGGFTAKGNVETN